MFRALIADEKDGKVECSIQSVEESSLPEGDVVVKVTHSTMNYKDGMVMNGLGKLVKSYPHVPGVDLAGVVESSSSDRFKPGDSVICTGWRVGEIWWGGYAEKASLKSEWLVPMPQGLDARKAMIVGTAGLTAMLGIMALEEHAVKPESGPILITGASGGVGSMAITLLSQLGYSPTALTGRPENSDYLKKLGASGILDRKELEEPSKRPLESETWAGAIDSVGGTILARTLAQMKQNGAIASVGLAASSSLETTVIPFLLRGVNLLGIDSVTCPTPRRVEAWNRIAKLIPDEILNEMAQPAKLEELPELGKAILKGKVKGRVVVDLKS